MGTEILFASLSTIPVSIPLSSPSSSNVLLISISTLSPSPILLPRLPIRHIGVTTVLRFIIMDDTEEMRLFEELTGSRIGEKVGTTASCVVKECGA
jgi:hypothetical protein